MDMIVSAYGGGTNSTAYLARIALDNIEELKPSLILFADTGGERPEIYEYVSMFSEWLAKHGLPEIITVKAPNKDLYTDCMDRNQLPAIAFGFKTCSQRWKSEPQKKYIRNWQPAKDEWSEGRKLTQLIGFDADESHRAKEFEDDRYIARYPLIEWDWGRDECVEYICKAGLPQPGKSSCFFCPSMKQHEIRALAVTNPDLMARALAMEANAQQNLTSVKGLGRNWAWADLLATADMFEEDFLQPIEQACGCYDG